MTTSRTITNSIAVFVEMIREGMPALIERGTDGAILQLGDSSLPARTAGEEAFSIDLSNGYSYEIAIRQLRSFDNEAGNFGDADRPAREAGCQQCGTLTPIHELDGRGACTDCAREQWDRLTAEERAAWCKLHRMHYPYEDKGPMTPEQLQRIAQLLESHPFRFAVTSAKNPHWYTLRHEWADVGDEVFNEVVRAIREHGYTEYFGSYPWRMLDVNGFKYWSYYSSYVEEVIVLNRKPLPDQMLRSEDAS